MKSWDYDAVTCDGVVYCKGCLPAGIKLDDPRVAPIFAEQEWDSYPVCDKCGFQHKYMSLTSESRREDAQARKKRQRLLGHRKPRLSR
jgi:hypothetical protein